jgi:hypothetical protein
MPDGFATTDPVRPGRREVAFSYQLPYDAASLDLNRVFAFPVGTFTLIVPDDIGGVVASGMALQGSTELGGRPFRQYVAEGISPGSEVRFRLTGLPAPMFARPRDLGLLVSGIGAVLLAGFLGFTIWRRRVRPILPTISTPASPAGNSAADSTATAAPPVQSSRAGERQALLEAIARLDEQFAAGEVDATTYESQRAEQKARLLALSAPAAAAQ